MKIGEYSVDPPEAAENEYQSGLVKTIDIIKTQASYKDYFVHYIFSSLFSLSDIRFRLRTDKSIQNSHTIEHTMLEKILIADRASNSYPSTILFRLATDGKTDIISLLFEIYTTEVDWEKVNQTECLIPNTGYTMTAFEAAIECNRLDVANIILEKIGPSVFKFIKVPEKCFRFIQKCTSPEFISTCLKSGLRLSDSVADDSSDDNIDLLCFAISRNFYGNRASTIVKEMVSHVLDSDQKYNLLHSPIWTSTSSKYMTRLLYLSDDVLFNLILKLAYNKERKVRFCNAMCNTSQKSHQAYTLIKKFKSVCGNVDMINPETGESFLHYFCTKSKFESTVDFIIQNSNTRILSDFQCNTPMHNAARFGNRHMMNILSKAGHFHRLHRNKEGLTPECLLNLNLCNPPEKKDKEVENTIITATLK